MKRHDPQQQQQRILRAVHDYIAQHAFPPTIRELCAAVNLNSSSMVRITLNQLELRGLVEIARLPNGIMMARGLRITPKGKHALMQTKPIELTGLIHAKL